MKEFKKLEEMSFRDYDKKFVLVKNTGNLLERLLPEEEIEGNDLPTQIKEPFYGLMYIDHECGVTLNVLGNVENKDLYVETIRLIARSDSLENAEFKIIDDKEYLYSKKALEKLDVYYENKNVNETRNEELLDKFRHPFFPDDVEVILPTEKGLEQMWARLMLKTNQDNLYVGELLNTSNVDEKYQTGRAAALVYYTEGDEPLLIINGLVQFKED